MVTKAQFSAAITGLRADLAKMLQSAPAPDWEMLTTKLPSGTLIESHEWLGQYPQMHEWIGNKIIEGMFAHDFSVRNRDYEATIEVDRDLIDDARLETVKPRLQQMAAAAKEWPIPHIWSLIENATSATLAACYDGKALVSATHEEGDSGVQTNIVSGAGVTLDNVLADLAKVDSFYRQVKGDRGQYLYGYSLDTVVIPAGNQTLINHFRTVQQGKQGDDKPDWSGEVKKVFYHPGLTGNDWYGFCTSRPIGALIWQQRESVHPVSSDEAEFMRAVNYIGVEARGAIAPGDWRCIVQVDNS